MRYQTPAEAEKTLREKGFVMSAATIRRRAKAGKIPHLTIGSHMVVDVDMLLPMMAEEKDRRSWVSSQGLSEMTGLTTSAIRRGVQEGWLPAERQGRRLRFSPEQAMEALRERSRACAQEAAEEREEKGRAAAGGEGKE